MSQFDFPRIHFSGNTSIDPATGNNNYHYPLVAFEPLSGTAVLPPRIYFNSRSELEAIVSQNPDINKLAIEETDGRCYLEIEEIDDPIKFKSWMVTPLGEGSYDQRWSPIYKGLKTEKENKVLFGLCPAYWNYFGTMNFSLENVKIHSIQTSSEEEPFTKVRASNPKVVNELLDASIYFENDFGKKNATMIDVSPTLSIFSQVFADKLIVDKEGKKLLEGKPIKSSLRQMSPTRLVNIKGIMASSGTFYTSIELAAINPDCGEVLELIDKYRTADKELIGLFIRYDLFGVEEDQNPNYKLLGEQSNPASSKVLGTISPQYKDDLKSAPFARLLMPKELLSKGTKVGTCFAHYNKIENLLSFDLIGSLPLLKQPSKVESHQILGEGRFELNIRDAGGESYLVQTLEFKEGGSDYADFLKLGGIFDFSEFSKEVEDLLEGEGTLSLRYTKIGSQAKTVLEEKQFHIITDQGGVYSEEGDDPALGYMNLNHQREKCQICIKRFGKVYDDPVKVMIVKLSVLPFGSREKIRVLEDEWIQNGSNYELRSHEYGQFFYAFYPSDHNIFPTDVKSYMIDSGAFVNLRVLKHYDWKEKFGGRKLDFELIYDEVLRDYDLIYPASGIITPFNQPNFQRIKRFLSKIMSEETWHSYIYMPSSRDLPRGKKELLFKWLNNNIDA